MLRYEAWSATLLSLPLVGVFALVQYSVWALDRRVAGSSRRFAILTAVLSFSASLSAVMTIVAIQAPSRSLAGGLFPVFYMATLASFLVAPGLAVIELMVTTELLVLVRRDFELVGWHLGSLAVCTSWFFVGVFIRLAGLR
jgi:hypothetical protein